MASDSPSDRDSQFAEQDFPMTQSELIEDCGDEQLWYSKSDETVGEVLGRLAEETYETPTEAREALASAVGHAAIGRRYYSDRDPSDPGESGPQQVSF